MPNQPAPIVVYPLPPQLPTSPYLDQLYAPIAAHGIAVRRGRPRHELPRLLLGRGPRVLHLHFFDELTQRPSLLATAARSLGFLLLLALLRLRGVRLVWTAHNLAPHEAYHPRWSGLVYRTSIRWCAAVIAHSQPARQALEQRYGALPRCLVIPHGSYVGLYGPPREQAASRAALGLPARGPVLLNFGTLRPYKGLEDLIGAFAQLPASQRGCLLVAGAAKDAAYAAELRRRAAGVAGLRLELRFVPDAELPTYLAAADLVVLPYHTLLTSGVLLWALSYGRAAVAPGFGPAAELVRESETGFLFAPGDTAALARALGRALVHPDLAALGRNGLALAQTFAWPAIAAQTAAVYRAACGMAAAGTDPAP